jgi:hypothetical protein
MYWSQEEIFTSLKEMLGFSSLKEGAVQHGRTTGLFPLEHCQHTQYLLFFAGQQAFVAQPFRHVCAAWSLPNILTHLCAGAWRPLPAKPNTKVSFTAVL